MKVGMNTNVLKYDMYKCVVDTFKDLRLSAKIGKLLRFI